ncbi:MAG: GntR family transcriptional regulator [Bacillota bacterium]
MKQIINVDRNSGTGIYKQIAEQVREAVKQGVLKPGDKLPTERELSKSLGIARATVNKAYEELKRSNVIEAWQGSGSYIKTEKVNAGSDKKQLVANCIEEFLARMEALHVSPGEILALVDIAIGQRGKTRKNASIAAIDTSEESLALFKEQFSSYANVEANYYLLDDMLKYSNAEMVFENYDAIITTIARYEQVTGMVGSLKDRVLKVAVSPTYDTIIRIAEIPKDSRIGIIAGSNDFTSLMMASLDSVNIDTSKVYIAFDDDASQMAKLILRMDVLIIPHFLLRDNQKLARQLHYFKGKGGGIIDFRCHIEAGSLIYIEERIRKILSE